MRTPLVVTPSGLRVHADQHELAELRARFAREYAVRLRGFFGPEVIDTFRRRLPGAAFSRRVENGLEIERTLEDPALVGLMLITLNDPALFSLVNAITSCGPIGCFSGRVQLKHADPTGGHYFPWHTDAVRQRLVGLTVNLSERHFEGGRLQMRRVRSRTLVAEMVNRDCGDAVLFRISRNLEHHVTPVTGPSTRIVVAGWFRQSPDFWQKARCASS